MSAPCAVAGCDKPVRARGWCGTHLKRWQRHGVADAPPPERSIATDSDAPGTWRRWGPECHWNTELDESDRLALVGHR